MICGREAAGLPDGWINWTCEECVKDELSGSVGVFDRPERYICGEHASAAGEINPDE